MIRLNDGHALPFIAAMANINLGAKVFCIAHYDNKDELTGGVLLMSDNGYSMEIHSASFKHNWGGRELLWAVFNYVFKVRKIKKLFGRVPENNYKARKFNKNLGFIEECVIDDVFNGGEGLVVMRMYEEDCRWVNCKPPKVSFAPQGATRIIEVYEYFQSNVGA